METKEPPLDELFERAEAAALRLRMSIRNAREADPEEQFEAVMAFWQNDYSKIGNMTWELLRKMVKY